MKTNDFFYNYFDCARIDNIIATFWVKFFSTIIIIDK